MNDYLMMLDMLTCTVEKHNLCVPTSKKMHPDIEQIQTAPSSAPTAPIKMN